MQYSVKSGSRQNVQNTRDAIHDRKAFSTRGSMSGGAPSSWGRLPALWQKAYHQDRPTYVVYSYSTPIAWYGDRGWVMPPLKYSVTTTSHQSACHAGIGYDAEILPV
jgi:hypothetical protein